MRKTMGLVVSAAFALGLAACSAANEEEIDAGNIEPPSVSEEVVDGSEEVEMPEMPTEEEQAAAAAAAQQEAETGVVYVGEDKAGTEVALPAGETLRIELETIPTAGYVWQIVEKPDFLELTGENTRGTNPAMQNLPGFTGGNHYMSFDLKALSEGTGVVKLTEGRPWETEEAPEGTFEVTVSVTRVE